MKSILDPSFKYTNAASTDLRKTFARVRREMKAKAAEQMTPQVKVIFIEPRRKDGKA